MLAGYFSWSLLFHNLELSNAHRYLYRCYVILWIFSLCARVVVSRTGLRLGVSFVFFYAYESFVLFRHAQFITAVSVLCSKSQLDSLYSLAHVILWSHNTFLTWFFQ